MEVGRWVPLEGGGSLWRLVRNVSLEEDGANLASGSGPKMGPSSSIMPSRVLKSMALSATPMNSNLWSPAKNEKTEAGDCELEALAFDELSTVHLRLSHCACCQEEYTWPVEDWQLRLEQLLPAAFELQDCNQCIRQNDEEVTLVTMKIQYKRLHQLRQKRLEIHKKVCGLGFEQKVELIQEASVESRIMLGICEALTRKLGEEWVSTGTFVLEGPLQVKSYIVESAR